MMRILVAVVCLATQSVPGQPLEYGPRAAALGGAGVALAGDATLLINPASAAGSRAWFAHAFASRAYGLSELSQLVAGAGHRIGGMAVTATVFGFGFKEYRDLSLQVGAARRIERARTDWGLRITATEVSIRGHGSFWSLSAGIGAIVALSRTLSIGLSIERVASAGENFGQRRRLSGGLAFQLADPVTFVADTVADPGFPVDWRLGIEATPVNAVSLRTGISAEPHTLSLGIRVHVTRLSADVAAQRHDQLGWSRIVGVAASG